MKKRQLIILALILVFVLSSCAGAYIRPTVTATLFRQQIPGVSFLFKIVLKLLPMMGYHIETSDAQTGTITTAPVEIKVDPRSCDCGNAMGIPIIKSQGTKVKVTFILGVAGNELSIRAEIVPELSDLMGTLAAGLDIVCVSTGRLEETLAKNFLESMKTKALQLIFH
jgi:hypothetical protein